MTLPKAWSYSTIKAFKTCPRQYYEVKVAKSVQVPDSTEATRYGSDFHEAAEFYVRDGTPLPERFVYAKPQLDILRTIPGDKYCEHEMGLTEKLEPCGFNEPHTWCRGIIDLLIINEESGVARVVDYKTGKSTKYADPSQLELMALMVFKHFPKIRTVKGGLFFVVANDFKKAAYYVDNEHTYWRTWMIDVKRLETAHTTGVWNPNKSGLCRAHCPVVTCTHNGKNNG